MGGRAYKNMENETFYCYYLLCGYVISKPRHRLVERWSERQICIKRVLVVAELLSQMLRSQVVTGPVNSGNNMDFRQLYLAWVSHTSSHTFYCSNSRKAN